MIYKAKDIGKIVKEDERYVVKDNTDLKNLVVSTTRLKSKKSTSGHKHEGQEEVYHFLEGLGTIYLDSKPIPVEAGDVVLIQDGVHHRVEAGIFDLFFICVFDGKRQH
jgi:mannose-6-phosphate isomerase-like protein (cupin superfamily)